MKRIYRRDVIVNNRNLQERIDSNTEVINLDTTLENLENLKGRINAVAEFIRSTRSQFERMSSDIERIEQSINKRKPKS